MKMYRIWYKVQNFDYLLRESPKDKNDVSGFKIMKMIRLDQAHLSRPLRNFPSLILPAVAASICRSPTGLWSFCSCLSSLA